MKLTCQRFLLLFLVLEAVSGQNDGQDISLGFKKSISKFIEKIAALKKNMKKLGKVVSQVNGGVRLFNSSDEEDQGDRGVLRVDEKRIDPIKQITRGGVTTIRLGDYPDQQFGNKILASTEINYEENTVQIAVHKELPRGYTSVPYNDKSIEENTSQQNDDNHMDHTERHKKHRIWGAKSKRRRRLEALGKTLFWNI